MIKKYPSPVPGHVRVVFELPSCIWADRIFLSGDFNNWNAGDIPLRQDRNGVWRAALDLPIGRRYEFRYLIDGEWRTDFHADGHADNTYGSQNSLVIAEMEEATVGGFHRNSQADERRKIRTRKVQTVRRQPRRRAVALEQASS
jgi:1,4-alpha-glucan branching enzyme